MTMSEEDKRRIQEEEAYRAQVRSQMAGEATKPEKKAKFLGIGCLPLMGVFLLLGFCSSVMTPRNEPGAGSGPVVSQNVKKKAPAAQAAAHAPKKTFTADYLKRVFDENQIAGDEAFKGRILSVSGRIHDVSNSIFDEPVVQLAFSDNQFMSSVHATFPKNMKGEISKLRKGAKITIVGKCEGQRMMSVILTDCRFGK